MFARTLILTFLGVVSLSGCQPTTGTGPVAAGECPCNESAKEPQFAALVRVEDTSQVCMVNDEFKGSTQIPVVVEGKTYYGCCKNCSARLTTDGEVRSAKDPVSGETVDKAVAVIGREPGGKVHYFASVDNLAKYRATP